MVLMEFRQIELFLAVADELHFGRAATRLGMAQPPLSQQIMRLERALDVRLFNRTSRSVTLTPAGQQLVLDGRALLEHRGDARSNVRRAAAGEIGALEIGFAASSALGLLPDLIARFREAYPLIALKVREGTVQAHSQALLEGRLDLAIVRGPYRHEGLAIDPLLSEPIVAVVSARRLGDQPPEPRRLGDQPPEIRLRDLAEEAFLMFQRSAAPELHDALMSMCRNAGFTPAIHQAADSWPSIAALVSAGLGVALAPASAALLLPPGAVACRIMDVAGQSDLVLMLKRSDRSTAASNFRSIALDLQTQTGRSARSA